MGWLILRVLAPTAFLAIFFLATGSPGWGQELRGNILGTVRDETGGALAGVQVTARSPALMEPRTTTTGIDGSYRFSALPPGEYALLFELEGFRSLSRQGIRVGLTSSFSVHAVLELSGVEETMTVTGRPPVVDVTTTSVGTSLTEEILEDIPTARDIWAAMALSPGFQMDGHDVGGSHAGTQTGYITYGFQGQNKTLLEGINVTENQDLNAGYFDYGSFEELQVGGSGTMGEQAGPGALLNVSVKSGGDDFHGSLYFDFENEDTVSDNVPDALRQPGGTTEDGFRAPSGGLERGNPITKQYDLDGGVGGPILEGRLWFYAGYRQHNQFKAILGLPGENAQTKLENVTVKTTFQLNAENQIIGFFNRRTKLEPLRALSLTTPVESAHYQDSLNRPWKIEWTHALSDRAFLDVQFGHWLNFFPLYPTGTRSRSVEGVPPGRIDVATGQRSGANNFYWERRVEKPQLVASLLYDVDRGTGSHHLKVGGETYREQREVLRFQPDDVFYRDRNGLPLEIELYNTPNQATNDVHHVSIYGQDAWTLNGRLTLNLGLRYDRYRLSWPEQSIVPNLTEFFEPSTTPATTVKTYNSLSPRLGVALDLTGEGTTVWKIFFGRYYFNPSIFHTDKENPAGNLRLRFRFDDRNGNGLLDGTDELGDFLRSLDGAGFFRVDRSIEHAYGDELSTHFERELADAVSFRASYIYKNIRNGWGLVDVGRVGAYDIPVTVMDDVTGEEIRLVDRQPDVEEDVLFTNPGRVGLPDYAADYHTFEMALRRRFRRSWLFMGSFEHTWASDFRDNGQFSTSPLVLARHEVCGVGQFECENVWTPNARRFGDGGKMDSAWWNLKLVGRYVLRYGFGVSASYRLQSGFNFARLIEVALPNAGTETVFAHPLEEDRSPSVSILDVRLDKTWELGGRMGRVTALVDVFNLFNASPVTNFRMSSGDRFKEVISILDPRVVRLGIRYEF